MTMSRQKIPDLYLRRLVLIANEILDFHTHRVILFNRESREFDSRWHYLNIHPHLCTKWQSKHRQEALLRVLYERHPVIGPPPELEDKEWLNQESMLVPLYKGDDPVGVLFLSPHKGEHYDPYDAYIAYCTVQIISNHYVKPRITRDMLNPLQFWMLHRRQFLAATPTLTEVLDEYLYRLVGVEEFGVLSAKQVLFANIRIFTGLSGTDEFCLRFCKLTNNYGERSVQIATKHEQIVSEQALSSWIERCSTFDEHIQPDINPDYVKLFDTVSSHIAVPCRCRGKSYGVLSVDSPKENAFDRQIVQALSILGAHMAPVIANALTRLELSNKETYLRNVLDAIPDEVLIIDKDARIIAMNKAKKDRFKNAHLGQYCYDAFELGRENKCSGCYALHTLETGQPIRQALWKYSDPDTKRTGYVEISSGRIELPEAQSDQAVEIVRHVNAREAMLRWMADAQNLLWVKGEEKDEDGQMPKWFVHYIGQGLQSMGFPRYRIYKYSQNRFYGLICFPDDSFLGENFLTFFLDLSHDIPSKVLVRDGGMRPIRFSVSDKVPEDKKYDIPKAEREWNYLTCYLKKVPSECAKYLGKGDIKSWIDIPLGYHDPEVNDSQIFGKISVDWGRECESRHTESDTAYEMALLSAFGRFSSVAIRAAQNYQALVRTEREKAVLQTSKNDANRFAHIVNNKLPISQYFLEKILQSEIPTALGEDAKHAKHAVDRVMNIAYNFKKYGRSRNLILASIKIRDCLDLIVSHCRGVFNYLNIVLSNVLDDARTQGLIIQADMAAFEDVFEMLILDSKRFHPIHKPEIRIACIAGKRSDAEDVEEIILVYEDNGPGVPDIRKREIFDLFYTTSEEGSGVGLSDIERIIHSHGGTITETGTEGKGVRFEIHLPATKGES